MESTIKEIDLKTSFSRPIGMTNPDTPPERVVLVACGSYNPVTNMHLRMFELARDALHRDKRYQVIAGIMSPVNDDYGKQDLVPSNDRCAMLRLALQDSDWISLDTWECEQDTWTETVKVLRYYRDNPMNYGAEGEFSSSSRSKKKKKRMMTTSNHEEEEIDATSAIRIMLLCGADFLQSFGRPGLWDDSDIEEIVRDFGIVCISRTGSDTNQIAHESDLLSKHRSNIHLVTEWLSNEISSTGVRRSLRRSESVKYLLPNGVISYIAIHKLYSPDKRVQLYAKLPAGHHPNITISTLSESDQKEMEEAHFLLDQLNNTTIIDSHALDSFLQQVDILRPKHIAALVEHDSRSRQLSSSASSSSAATTAARLKSPAASCYHSNGFMVISGSKTSPVISTCTDWQTRARCPSFASNYYAADKGEGDEEEDAEEEQAGSDGQDEGEERNIKTNRNIRRDQRERAGSHSLCGRMTSKQIMLSDMTSNTPPSSSSSVPHPSTLHQQQSVAAAYQFPRKQRPLEAATSGASDLNQRHAGRHNSRGQSVDHVVQKLLNLRMSPFAPETCV